VNQKFKLPHNPVSDRKFYGMVASWLKGLRRDTGLSLAQAAEGMGWNPTALERAEETGLINASQLRQVARAYYLDQDVAVGQVLKLYLASIVEAE
jgi:hypothetical protein